jgi:hypothetical protein
VNKRRELGLLITLGVAISTATFWFLRPREPVYQGQTLSFWFDQFNTTNRPQAEIAIRQIGTRAVPFLLKKAKYADEDGVYEGLYRTIYSKLPVVIRGRIPLPKPLDGDFLDDGYKRLASALALLGPPAVPQLIQAMEDRHSNVRLAAVRAAMLIGSNADSAIPALAELVNDSNGLVRVEAVFALSVMGPNKKLTIPALIRALNDSNRGPKPGMTVSVRENAACALGDFGFAAQAAVLPLTKLLSDTNSFARLEAAIALWRIKLDTNVIPLLIAELEAATDALSSRRILNAFGEMGPAAKAAVPGILKTIRDRRGMLNDHGIDIPAVGLNALEEIDPEAATKAGLE